MKAWQFITTNEPLVLADIAEPVPGPGEVVLDIRAAGLCHSDVGAMTDPGWLALIPNRPIVIGHEIAGVVSAVGEGVTDVTVGDRVGVCPTASEGAPGYARDGGFTYKHRVAAADLVLMPPELSFELAALGTDAGMTSYHAVMVQGRVKAGDKVGIVGLGGLGQVGARIAVVTGAEVHVAEINREVWPLAEKIGATSVVADVAEWAGRDFDVIVDFAGYGDTTARSIDAVRRDGRIVVVGMGTLESTINTRDLILKQAVVIGSNGGTKDDVAAVYEMLASGDLEPVVNLIGFDEIPDGLEQLREHSVTGRVVATIGN
ncbi:zinc-binding dehydrogenase [Georgenia sp. EYE_87]|uniref:zinc-binding dehydrogenase n=1 Tax=Georgenia sp. EYE_87 TaxID=2853448 RepID=UPI0020051677|nr:zinc-binding dehydrogenase [Georgenia sp. EYE_87]MCK6212248.1 zinc-binding dehydrogenase [Georgenia sp. EYE_87]